MGSLSPPLADFAVGNATDAENPCTVSSVVPVTNDRAGDVVNGTTDLDAPVSGA
jgi:hypothetical protein